VSGEANMNCHVSLDETHDLERKGRLAPTSRCARPALASFRSSPHTGDLRHPARAGHPDRGTGRARQRTLKEGSRAGQAPC
jgi:hypothetical protein